MIEVIVDYRLVAGVVVGWTDRWIDDDDTAG